VTKDELFIDNKIERERERETVGERRKKQTQ